MGFLDGLFETKRGNPENATSRAISRGPNGMYQSVLSGWSSANWDLNKAISNGYERLHTIFRCVDAAAANFADRELYVQQGSRISGQGRRVLDAQVEYVLNNRANPDETAWMFKYRLMSQLLLSRKGAFVENVPNAEGRTAQLQLLDASNVEIVPDPKGKVKVKNFRVKQADGRVVEMDPDQIIWIRLKPHPTDPYAQMTPLVAAGIVADTEWMARVYNRSLLNQSGKPGVVVAVRGELDKDTGERLKAKLQGGPETAGRAIAFEADGIDLVNLFATPEEIGYLSGLNQSKEDIFLAFGTPESVLGNASGRTFDNADAERLNWWMDTESNNCNGVAAGFDIITTGGLDDDLYVVVNYDDVDVLKRADNQRKQQLANEVAAGLRTLDSYLMETGGIPTKTPVGQVYWLPATGKVPAGDPAAVQQALNIVMQLAPAASQFGANQTGAAGDALPSTGVSDTSPQATPSAPPAPQLAAVKDELASIEARIEEKMAFLETQMKQARREERRRLRRIAEPPVLELPQVKEDPYELQRKAAESELYGALNAWGASQGALVAERMDLSRVRKGTRHWEGEGTGTKALDPSVVVDIKRWERDLVASFRPTMEKLARKQLRVTFSELDSDNLMDEIRIGDPHGDQIKAQVDALLSDVSALVAVAGHNQSQRIMTKIQRMDSEGASLSQIKAAVRQSIGSRSKWNAMLARTVTSSVIEGTFGIATAPVEHLVNKHWNAHKDERTRPTHRAADGQIVPGDKDFIVGGCKMAHPNDLSAPIEERAGCRCWASYSVI